ncbi:hypothetical protein [Aeromonas hydrophila]|uniref:hypothetical protein n=1 Tax=Aeromonas hydrophila TaxID=644 RepID=UPI0007603538|nr:hypothetical protein [Aeromonas hydrophila]KWR66539.1 hypothetical protein ATO50_10565 [Aeromonas hydrophila]HAU4929571.1 hypothetical protein [Aeromonas hydrophila]
MLTLLLCSSLWQFEAPQAAPHANGLALTPAQPASPSLRDHISGQLSEAWLARKPSVSVTLEEKKSSYPQDSLLEESRRQQDEGWDARLTFN